MREAEFQKQIWDFYHQHGRHDLPWRKDMTPYRIAVSEVMLQQTQVLRVIAFFEGWMRQFPDWSTLAEAPQTEVLQAWQGLGYNRRALYLHRLAAEVMAAGGELPDNPAGLRKLPGIGPNTAGSIAAFAFNRPAVFIETNIRRAYLHNFFPNQSGVTDQQLLPLIAQTMDHQNPREWYWALMDYGSALPKTVINPNRRSRHYSVQSRFEGSVRQLRGEVLRQLLTGSKSPGELPVDARLGAVLSSLETEGFVEKSGGNYRLRR